VFAAAERCYGRRKVEFRILGPLQVLDGETLVRIPGSKPRTVLALLLLHANEVVRTDRLVDDLWGEDAPRNASAALHTHVSRLRKALGPDVLARREWGYVLRANADAIDLHRFESLVAAAEPLPARERSAKLAEALQLWRGSALADIANEPSLQTEVARLDDLRLTTLERRIDADLEAGRNAELVSEIEALIAVNPLREHLRWQLILALYRAGRQAEALEVYRETRRLLTEELGIEPSPELRELERATLRQDPTIAAAAAVPPPAAGPAHRSRRRAVPLALLALALVGLGVGAAIVFAGDNSQPVAAHAPLAAATTGTSTVATSSARAATNAQAQTVSHAAKPGRITHPQRSANHAATHVVVAARSPSQTSTHPTRTKPTSTTTAATSRTPPVKPKIVTISDNFDGNQIDGTIWYQIYQGSGWSLSEHGGHLEFAFPPGAAPAPGGQFDNYGGHVGTLCKFPGDFDARVDFTLPQWPAANGMSVNFWVFYEPNNYGWAGVWRSSSAQWGEQYGGAIGPRPGGGAPLDDPGGTLRITRKGGLITSSFLHNGKWISVANGRSTATVVITVGAQSPQKPQIRRDEVVVDVDNFTVTAANPICPPGAQGSN
jgi:DNA-binding SARP family transcriptional activator